MNPKDEAKEWYDEYIKRLYNEAYADPQFFKELATIVSELITQARKLALQEAIDVVEEERRSGKQMYQDRVVACRKNGADGQFIKELQIEADGVYSTHTCILSKLQGLRGEE